MDNNELLTVIAREQTGELDNDSHSAEKMMKFLIVMIKGKRYAFFVEQIKEIVMNVPLFFVPFTPSYIRGFINRHGEPHTVFDLNALFEGEKLESSTFLISNFENDQMAFLISDVIEILKVYETEIRLIKSVNEQDIFFSGSIGADGAEIFVLNLPNIIGKLEHDLESP